MASRRSRARAPSGSRSGIRTTARSASATRTRCRSGRARAGTTCASCRRSATIAWRFSRKEEVLDAGRDLYVGGADTTTLHLLYAAVHRRKVLFDAGLVSTKGRSSACFIKGMIHKTSYKSADGKYRHADEVELRDGSWVLKTTGEVVETKLDKRSKSRYNVVNPDDMANEYGADAMRMYELFIEARSRMASSGRPPSVANTANGSSTARGGC